MAGCMCLNGRSSTSFTSCLVRSNRTSFRLWLSEAEIRGREFDGYFLDIGLPETLEQGHLELPRVRVRPAAFLDRKVLVNSGEGGSFRPEAFQWTRGGVDAIRSLNDHGHYVFVMSNPSGTAHRTRAVGDARRLNAAMQERLAREGAHVDRFYGELESRVDIASGHAIDAAKQMPDASLLDEAMNEWPIVGERSFFIGMNSNDIESARSAGISWHVLNGGDLARLVHSLLRQTTHSFSARADQV